jgi:toxin CcdB
MARFDVYKGASGKGLLLDCQSDLLDHFESRVVVPLLPAMDIPKAARLNPVFNIANETYVMSTQLIFAIPTHALGMPITSLSNEYDAITGAVDMLFFGF